MEHLLLFDGECGLCHRAVRWVLAHDKHERFAFAPLQGPTAAKYLEKPIPLDTMVLVEHFQEKPTLLRYGKAVLRLLWHIGGAWRWLGWCSYLPGWLADPIYRAIARHRHVFGGELDAPSGRRFLP